MTSELPPEAHHYRKSMTPESPRPLHPPEPSAFPVLRNQMDPIFNDTTTYDIPVDPPTMSDGSLTAPPQPSELLLQVISATQHDQQPPTQAETHEESNGAADIVLNGSSENETLSTNDVAHSSNAAVSDLQRTLDSLASVTQASNGTPGPSPGVSASEGLIDAGISRTADASAAEPNQHPSTQDPQPIASETQYQSLFDAISKSSTDAVDSNISDSAPANAHEELAAPRQSSENPLPLAAGLPPRPPPQEKPSIHPNYSPNDDIQTFHQLSPQNANSASLQSPVSGYRPSTTSVVASSVPPPQSTPRAANGLPPPPIATFQQPSADTARTQSPQTQAVKSYAPPSLDSPSRQQGPQVPEDEEQPWGADIQKKYDDFLQSEREYVTEGVWDRFPPGSRLFIGNLLTEKVTKRDVFHVFHKHGKLAQISLKQAYGFVQFLESSSSYAALEQEEGVAIRGRKIHLEIAKPQRNSRNAGGEGRSGRRRSRSPDRRRGPDRSAHVDRAPFSDFRDEPIRRRDDYRPIRSPSPRGYRGRDDYRPRNWSPGRYAQHDRPPNREFGHYRSSSPQGFDDDAALPLPRREPRDVPDVQILILEEVDQAFSRFVENGFKQKDLKASTIHLNPRITLGAVVKRQIIEGVQGVVKLTGSTQRTGRVPLQVFDRGSGATSVNFHEYIELDVSVAADIIIQARQKERSMYPPQEAAPRQPSYGYPQQSTPYNQPASQPYQQHYPPHQAPPPPPPPQHQPSYPLQRDGQYAGPIPSQAQGNGQNLQDLLANLRQLPQNQGPGPASNHVSPASGTHDIGALLSNVARHQNPNYRPPMPQYQQPPASNPYNQRGPGPTYGGPSGGPAYGGYGGTPQQGPAQDVRNIMDQLAKWKQ